MSYRNVVDSSLPYEMVGNKSRIIVIRNTVVEPLFGNILLDQMPGFQLEYRSLPEFLAMQHDDPAIVLLYLPALAPDLFDQLYCMTETQRRTHIDHLKNMLAQLISRLTQAVFFTFELDFEEPTVLGEASWNAIVTELNQYLYKLASSTNIRIADINSLISRYGTGSMLCPRIEFSLGLRYTKTALEAFALDSYRLLQTGMAKKVVVLDCDGVLWGGVLGDDGIEHIMLSRDGIGCAYRLFQRELLRLCNEGVLLCLCSKNDENDVMRVFAEHPDMLLRPEHITSHRIGWGNKADSILSIADELNLGVDSFVFIDDSRFETEAVATMIPNLEVLCLEGKRPYEFIGLIRQKGWFEKQSLTEEDRYRGMIYRQQIMRKKVQTNASNYADYLMSLQTEITIETVTSPLVLARVAELTQRTNQFNLSGKRFTEAELCSFNGCKNWHIYTLSASDRFGSLGLVAAAVVHDESNQAVIEGFYLSCRAFARGFEQTLLKRISDDAASRGYDVVGIYNKTSKNERFSRFYTDSGITVKKYE